MTRAVIYMRRSEPDENDYTFEVQEDDCAALAARKGYTVIATLREDGLTGHDSLDTRPVLKEVRRMVRSRETEAVLVWKYDRLARDFLDQAFVMREAKMSGVIVESATEPVPDGPMGWVMQAMHGGMSEQEWHKTKQRLRAGVEKRVAHGKYLVGGRAPFGYAFADSKKTKLVADPLTAPIVVRIFELVSSGASCHEAARILAREDIPSPTGMRYWAWPVIRRMINNPLYVGVAIAFRTRERTKYVINPTSGESAPKTVRVPGESVVLPDGTVPALVSLETAQRARQYIQQHRSSPLSGRVLDNQAHLLRGGFAVCAGCGKALSMRTHGNTPYAVPTYRCDRHIEMRVEPHGVSIAASRLDEFVWGKFVQAVSEPGVVQQAMKMLEDRRDAETAHQLTVLRGLLDENIEQQDGLRETAKLTKHENARARLANQADQLAEDEDRIRSRMSELERQDAVLVAAQTVLRKFARLGSLDGLDFTAKRRMLFDFGVRVVVGPAHKKKNIQLAERCVVEIDVLSRVNDAKTRTPRPCSVSSLVSCIRVLLVNRRDVWSCELRIAL